MKGNFSLRMATVLSLRIFFILSFAILQNVYASETLSEFIKGHEFEILNRLEEIASEFGVVVKNETTTYASNNSQTVVTALIDSSEDGIMNGEEPFAFISYRGPQNSFIPQGDFIVTFQDDKIQYRNRGNEIVFESRAFIGNEEENGNIWIILEDRFPPSVGWELFNRWSITINPTPDLPLDP